MSTHTQFVIPLYALFCFVTMIGTVLEKLSASAAAEKIHEGAQVGFSPQDREDLAKDWAHAVHDDIVSILPNVPLLLYDASNTDGQPFSAVQKDPAGRPAGALLARSGRVGRVVERSEAH